MESDRLYAVVSRLTEYVKSPSLRHIRDPHQLQTLGRDILWAVDRSSSIWRKWDGPRDEVAKVASPCWIPVEDLCAYLNQLPGPTLTITDVVQRLRAVWEEPYGPYPDENVRAGCEAIYAKEKAQGTELLAIAWALREFIDEETERLDRERREAYRRRQQQERQALQQRFLAGADCGWTPVNGSPEVYCRRNGRAFRLEPAKDKRWALSRIADYGDAGSHLGIYRSRGDATKAIEKLAYAPEPRW